MGEMCKREKMPDVPLARPAQPYVDGEAAFVEILKRVMSSGQLVLGKEVEQFEKDMAKYLGPEVSVASCANGTDAIYLSVSALGLPKGSMVATAANASNYSSSSIMRANLTPYYLDVDLESGQIPLSHIERALESGVSSVIVTHLFGRIHSQIESIANLCRESGVPLIEDCAQCQGAEYAGKKAGTFGDIAAFSFYPTKNLGAMGDGGAVASRSNLLIQKVLNLRQYGWSEKYIVGTLGGINSRLDELQAGFLSYLLPELNRRNKLRSQIAEMYLSQIDPMFLTLPEKGGLFENVWHLFVLRLEGEFRDSFRAKLLREGIDTGVHYPLPDHLSVGAPFWVEPLPNTEQRAKQMVSLPIFPEMTQLEIDRVVNAVNSWRP